MREDLKVGRAAQLHPGAPGSSTPKQSNEGAEQRREQPHDNRGNLCQKASRGQKPANIEHHKLQWTVEVKPYGSSGEPRQSVL